MDGISAASSIIELISFSKDCLEIYREVRNYDNQKQNELRFRLAVEAITFKRWCSITGIEKIIQYANDNPESWKTSDQFRVFRNSIDNSLRFGNEDVARLIIAVLKGLKSKFEDARNRINTAGPSSNGSRSPRSSSSWKVWKRSGEQPRVTSEPQYESSMTVVHAMKWVFWDRRTFMQLLDDLTQINQSLLAFLGSDLRRPLNRQCDIEILGQNTLNSSNSKETVTMNFNCHSRMEALTQMKHMQDQENGAESPPSYTAIQPVTSTSRVPQYHLSDFDSNDMQIGRSRVLSSLSGSQVIIEWKFYSSSHPLRFGQILRLGSLVTLLGKSHVHKEFHIPLCRGLVNDEHHHRIGLIFEVPGSNKDSRLDCNVLQQLIQDSRKTPSIGQRLSIARQLAIAVHHLHSVHWLHKSLRSDNILYFFNTESSELPDSNGSKQIQVNGVSRGNDQYQTSSLPPFYLFGLDLSRPNHPSELSETLSASTAGSRELSENVALYSHPDSLRKKGPGNYTRFVMEYDVYSLGLIFLEIGLWHTLRDMRREALEAKLDFRNQVMNEYCEDLRAMMGDIYFRVVQRCLHNDFDLGDKPNGADEDIALQLAFEKQVICELEKCNA